MLTKTGSRMIKIILNNKTIILIIFALGALLWKFPHPQHLNDKACHIFILFFATIIAIILKLLPMGALAFIAMTIATLTGTLSLEETLHNFSNDIVWLIVFSFFIAKSVTKTGLADRLAYGFITLFGNRILGLSYGLLLSEVLLAPVIPSVTARSGGIIFPIIQGIVRTSSYDTDKDMQNRFGTFLIIVAFQSSILSSAMFLTAMVANPLLVSLTGEMGYTITWSWWIMASSVPALLSLTLLPLFLYKLYPPKIIQTPHAVLHARKKLKELGKWKKSESWMIFIFISLLICWSIGKYLGIKPTVAIMSALSFLILIGILSWDDFLEEKQAWNTMIWFVALITLASFLNKFGFISWLTQNVIGLVGGWPWEYSFVALALIYFYSHYLFAGSTAQVGAMYPTFLMTAIGLGTPPFLAIPVLIFSSSLFGGLTHYGSGAAPIFYGSSYVETKKWWKIGLMVSLYNLFIWGFIGSLWWKLLGMW